MKKTSFILSLSIIVVCLYLSSVAQADPICAEAINVTKLKGNGIIKFQGDGKISIKGEGVIYIAKNGEVDLVGFSSFFENDEDGKRVYIVPEGTVEIEGEDIDMSFYGADFGVNVTVTGQSELYAKGYGYYRTGFSMGVWSPDGITFNLGN